MENEPKNAWVFVSHSSADLHRVREVRNYLEDKGTSPLIFHLLSLKKPDEFWPIIKREISERNFFLYCDSESDRLSKWVARERRTVETVRKRRPIRIGHVQVDVETIDTSALDAFVADVRAYIAYVRSDAEVVRHFVDALQASGFLVSIDYDNIPAGVNFADMMDNRIQSVAQNGWLLAFFSKEYLQRGWGVEGQPAWIKLEFESAMNRPEFAGGSLS